MLGRLILISPRRRGDTEGSKGFPGEMPERSLCPMFCHPSANNGPQDGRFSEQLSITLALPTPSPSRVTRSIAEEPRPLRHRLAWLVAHRRSRLLPANVRARHLLGVGSYWSELRRHLPRPRRP